MHKTVRRLLYGGAIAAVITAGAAAGISSGLFGGFTRRATDSLFPSAKTDPRVVVVAIDDKTIRQQNGQVTLPRETQALIGNQLEAAGAAVVVWDVIFTPDKPGDDQFESTLASMRAPIIGASYEQDRSTSSGSILHVKTRLGPLQRFATAGNTQVAHVNIIDDPSDGVVRSVSLVYDANGHNICSLSLQALLELRGQRGCVPTFKKDGGLQVGNQQIPTEARYRLRLNFAAGLDNDGHDHAIVSAADVIDGSANPKQFRNAVVFIGATEPVIGDTQLVPVDKTSTYPGVLIHANALNTMLTSSFLRPSSDTETVVTVGFIALLIGIGVLFLPVLFSVLGSLLLGAAFTFLTYWRFDHGHVMNVVYGYVSIALAFVIGLGIKYLTETRQRRRVSNLFAQYVPEAVAKELEESGALASHVEGERLDVGLFFCDLRGFTSLSATLEPSEVRAMLNEFYDLLTEIIHSHNGTVLKFVGDEVFAVFGAPLPCENNAQATLDCAMEIQLRAPELDEDLKGLGIPPVKFGIGMNAGAVVAAHIGGGRRRQYDIVGDTVNLGSRLCSQAGKGEIVLPEAMIERLTNVPPMESMGAVQLKGLEQPVPLFKVVVGESEPRQATPAPAPA